MERKRKRDETKEVGVGPRAKEESFGAAGAAVGGAGGVEAAALKRSSVATRSVADSASDDKADDEGEERSSSSAEQERLQQLLCALDKGDDFRPFLRLPAGYEEMPCCDEHPWTALHVAASLGDESATRAIADASPESLQVLGGCAHRTPIQQAARRGQLGTFKILLSATKRHNKDFYPVGRLLHLSVKSGNCELVQYVLRESIDVGVLFSNTPETIGRLFNLCMTRNNDAVTKALALAGDDTTRSIALAWAASRNMTSSVRLLTRECNAYLRREEYALALANMPTGSFTRMIEDLVVTAGTLDVVRGIPLLAAAILLGFPRLTETLLKRGADPNEKGRDEFWSHPLWIACLGTADDAQHPLGTDHSVQMVRQLLSYGANPFLMDAKGNRLVDALWCGYWWNTEAGKPKLMQPQFERDENKWRIVGLLKSAMICWSPRRHCMFPQPFRRRAWELLLVNHRKRRVGLPYLPRELCKVVLEFLAHAEARINDGQLLRSALRSFHVPHIKTLLTGRGVEDSVSRKRKEELVELAIQMREQEEAAERQQAAIMAALPPVFGRLVARVDGSDEVLTLDIPNTQLQPWVNIGRRHNKHPKGGATLDLDLAGTQYSRRISRLHATIRYNVQARDWQIQVRGRNGLQLEEEGAMQRHMVTPSAAGKQVWMSLSRMGLRFWMPFAHLSFELEDYVTGAVDALQAEATRKAEAEGKERSAASMAEEGERNAEDDEFELAKSGEHSPPLRAPHARAQKKRKCNSE